MISLFKAIYHIIKGDYVPPKKHYEITSYGIKRTLTKEQRIKLLEYAVEQVKDIPIQEKRCNCENKA